MLHMWRVLASPMEVQESTSAWTFAAALDELVSQNPAYSCPCIRNDLNRLNVPIPSFVGDDYFCDTGSHNRFQYNTLYSADPLWDGAGCGPQSTCCSFNTPPWFYKQLPQPPLTTLR